MGTPPAGQPIPRSEKVRRWLLGGVFVLFFLSVAGWLAKDSILRPIAERRLSDETGLKIRIGKLKLSFSPARLALKELKVFNPPGFTDTAFTSIPEVVCVLDLAQMKTNRLHFNQL